MTDSRTPIGISVVVPSYNQGRFIDDCIRSLLDQNYPNLEIQVMDGGSTDDTIDRLSKYGDRIKWVSASDEGQTDAIMKGFALTSKPWITWLNSDDVQSDRALWRANDAVAAAPDSEVLVGRGHYMDENLANERPYPTIDLTPGIDVRNELFTKGYLAQPSTFYTRAAYHRAGGLDRSLNFCMDCDLWSRFATSGARFTYIDADISGSRWYEDTKTSGQTLSLYAEILATQRRIFGAVAPFFVQAVSDNFYSKFHAPFYGDKHHLLFRWIFFKAFWVALNAQAPWYCFKGFFTQTIAKSGPIIGDRMTFSDWRNGAFVFLKNRRRPRA